MAQELPKFLLGLCFIVFNLDMSDQITATQGEEFSMFCYSDPDGDYDDYHVDLTYAPSESESPKIIAQYKPETGQITGSVTKPSSSYYGRLTFTTKNYIIWTNVKISDEGIYSCIVRVFGLENVAVTNNLTVLVRPEIELVKMTDPLVAGSSLINAASCIAKNGKPEAEVFWTTERNLAFNLTKDISEGDSDGTKTSTSILYVAPNKYYNKQVFMCVVNHPALQNKRNITSYVLNVVYPPGMPLITVVNDGEVLKCSADGNPPPQITWYKPGGAVSMTSPVDTVYIISPEDPARQNDTYTCTASNGIEPSSSANITTGDATTYVHMVSQSNTGVIVGAVIGGLLLLICVAALVYWFFLRRSREKDDGPYKPTKISRHVEDSGESSSWGRSSARPTIEHANESLNKNAPPSPTRPPPQDDDSVGSQSDIEEDMEGHDVDLDGRDDDEQAPLAGIVSKNSINFQPYWRNSVTEHRRQRPSTSPHRRSQNRPYPEPSPRTAPQPEMHYDGRHSDPHYEVPPGEYYDDNYQDQEPLADHHPSDEPIDDRFYDLPEDRYPNYQQRYKQPTVDALPPYSQDPVHYASIDHNYKGGKPTTRPPYHEPVEYAEIRSHGQIV